MPSKTTEQPTSSVPAVYARPDHAMTSTATQKSAQPVDSPVYPQSQVIRRPDDNQTVSGVPTSVQSVDGSTAVQGESNSRPLLFVLFCAFRGTTIHSSEISISRTMDDDGFVAELREKYKQLRGFWRYWLGPKQFYYCEFTKFRKIFIDRIVKVCPELPKDKTYQCHSSSVSSISRHEWHDRFYNRSSTCGRCNVLARIPKRKHRFNLDLHITQDAEELWGLNVEYQVACYMVLIWFGVISIVGLGFWIWWYRNHPGDWDKASVIFMASTGAMTALWLPLSKHFDHNF